LIPLLDEIENNKRKWKSLYIAVWGLPAAKSVFYTPNELNRYLTSYDHEIHITQLIKIFTLLENYLFEYYELNKDKESFIQKTLKLLLNSRFIKYLAKKSNRFSPAL